MPAFFWVDVYSYLGVNQQNIVIQCEQEYLSFSMFQVFIFIFLYSLL
jgi:hypothetical protein